MQPSYFNQKSDDPPRPRTAPSILFEDPHGKLVYLRDFNSSDPRDDSFYEDFYEECQHQGQAPPPLGNSLEIPVIPKFFSKKTSDSPKTPENSTNSFLNNLTSFSAEFIPSFELKPDLVPEFQPEFDDSSDYEEYFGSIYEMAKDQHGCRILQAKLDKSSEIPLIFSELIDHLYELMLDAFGNYLCQKLISVASYQQLAVIIDRISSSILQISLDSHGTRSIQKLIESIVWFPDLKQQLSQQIQGSCLVLINDNNGNHVIQKCLQFISPPHNQFIYDVAAENLIMIATHRHGCCVIQKCLENANSQQRDSLVTHILENAIDLVQDAFGNYVVQHTLGYRIDEFNIKLAHIFASQIGSLSAQKYSSNVIEKCLEISQREAQEIIIQEISKPTNIINMIEDQYGNFVLQKAINLADHEVAQKMINTIKPRMQIFKKSQVARKVLNNLAKKYPELNKNAKQQLGVRTLEYVFFRNGCSVLQNGLLFEQQGVAAGDFAQEAKLGGGQDILSGVVSALDRL